MFIVYLSIALIVASLVFLGWYAYKTFKETKPAINEVNHTIVRVQQKTNSIKAETTVLTQNQQELMADIEYKKQAVTSTINEAKQTAASVKHLFKIKPFAKVERKRKARMKSIQTQ